MSAPATAGTPRVVVLGDLATDVVVALTGPPVAGSDAPARITMRGGGAGANVAAWLVRAGAAATLVAMVGDDDAGRLQVEALRAAGVDTSGVAVDPRRPTGVVVVLVDPDGERTMLPDRGANLALAPHHVPARVLAGAAHLHVSGYALLDPGPRRAALHALGHARSGGVPTSVDASSAGPLRQAGPEAFLRWAEDADLLRANLDEARLLTGLGDPEDCARRLAARRLAAVVTLGAGGAVWSDGHDVRWEPARTAAARDTTGAGDAFTAGVIAARLDGAGPAVALARGAELAAEAVGRQGARPPGGVGQEGDNVRGK